MPQVDRYPVLPGAVQVGDIIYVIRDGKDYQLPMEEVGLGFRPDAVGLLEDRGDYDDEAEGFSYLAQDDDPPSVYFRQGESGWSAAVPFSPTASVGSIADVVAGIEGLEGEDRLNAETLKNFAAAAAAANISTADFLAALAALMGANTFLATNGDGEFDPAEMEPFDPATVADTLGGTEGKDTDPSTNIAPLEWTELAIEGGVATVPWGEELPRYINAAAGFALAFEAMDAPYLGKRLSGLILIANSGGGSRAITLTDGDGVTNAPTVLANGADIDTLGSSDGDKLLVYYDTLPDGTVTVTPWGAF